MDVARTEAMPDGKKKKKILMRKHKRCSLRNENIAKVKGKYSGIRH